MKKINALVLAISLIGATSALAGNVLVSEFPWGSNQDVSNMTTAFGAGNFTTYTNYGTTTAASIFNGANQFVMLEGGAASDASLSGFLGANGAAILNWVSNGGALLIQSAGWYNGFSFGPATFNLNQFNGCGTMTAAGSAALSGTATSQCGNWLAHDTITGAGLTAFMTGDDNGGAIIAGTDYGNGYLMFSGLTTSQWHFDGPSLVNTLIGYTAGQADGNAVPEPASLALAGIALVGLVAGRRKSKSAI